MHGTDHAVETEIKLRLTPDARTALERHPAFNPPRASAPETRQETTTYFDTPDWRLRSKGVTLRVRQRGGSWKQTAKAASNDGGQPLSRGEWEWPLGSDKPDLHRLTETPIAGVVERIDAAALQPVFRTEIERTARLVRVDGGTTIEAVFDEGHIIARSDEPVSEVELELKSGEPRSLYGLALELLSTVPLAIEAATKAERGFRLQSGNSPQPSKAADVSISAGETAAQAFRHIFGSVLGHMLSNIDAAQQGEPEGVHQIRVAVRRMRAALALFKPRLQPDTADRFNEDLHRLGRIFGAARDWDVFVLETLPEAEKTADAGSRFEPLRHAAEAARAVAHCGLRAELDAPSFTRAVFGMAGWIAEGSGGPPLSGTKTLETRIDHVAPELLHRMRHKVIKRGRHLDHASREQLHSLRKAIKKLRYSVEFLETLYRHKQVKAYLKPCKELQKILGAVNDAAATPMLAERLHEADSDELRSLIGKLAEWTTKRGENARSDLSDPWHELRSADPFWD